MHVHVHPFTCFFQAEWLSWHAWLKRRLAEARWILCGPLSVQIPRVFTCT